MRRYEARLSGSGGQGVVLAGIVLAEAAGVGEGYRVVQTQSYGPESRGTACKSDVILSAEEVKYPLVRRVDLLVALTQDTCDRYAGLLKPDGVLIYDPLLVTKPPVLPRAYPIEATAAALNMGWKIAANMVALGAVAAITGIVRLESLEKAVLARSPGGTGEANLDALRTGYAAGRDALSAAMPGHSGPDSRQNGSRERVGPS